MDIKNVNAYILSGGKSARMGENKAFLTLNNKKFIDIIYKELSFFFKDVFVVTKKEYDYLYKGYRVIYDICEEQSPVVGILTALTHCNSRFAFIKSCDNPLFSIDLIKRMIDLAEGYDVVIPFLNDGYHPLFGVYSKKCIDIINRQIKKNNFKVIDFLSFLDVYLIREEEAVKYDKNLISFFNINTKKDYESFIRNYL